MQLGAIQKPVTAQSQKLSQIHRLSQSQLTGLRILSLSNVDLQREIYDFSEKNPALEVEEKNDGEAFFDNQLNSEFQKNDRRLSDERYSSYASSASYSDEFNSALESSEDFRETLSEHLLHQLKSMPISSIENEFCEKLIYNLDGRGHHILSVDSIFKGRSEKFKNHCLKIVQNLEPIGICCKDFQESLLIQATYLSETESLPKAVLFLLEHFDFLNPPQIQKITKKTNDYLSSLKRLKFEKLEKLPFTSVESESSSVLKTTVSELEIEEAMTFIKKLNPFPASNFRTEQTNYAFADVVVERFSLEESELEAGELPFKISIDDEKFPVLSISKEFQRACDNVKSDSAWTKSSEQKEISEQKKAELDFLKHNIQTARDFIEGVEFRKKTLLSAVRKIVEHQLPFFLNGYGNLNPFTQHELAEELSVSDSTVSRLAKEKYLSCEWGLFPLSYFFTNAAVFSLENGIESKENVKFEIAKIIESHKDEPKKLSDQKIADILSSQGIKIARRTVAKYRTELNFSSSYERI